MWLHSAYSKQFIQYYHQYGFTVHTTNNSYCINTSMATHCIQQTIHMVLKPIWLHCAYSKQFIQY